MIRVKNIRVDIPDEAVNRKIGIASARSSHFATIAIILKTFENNPHFASISEKKEKGRKENICVTARVYRSIFDRFPYVTMRTFLCGSDIRSDPERYRMIHVFPRYRESVGNLCDVARFAFPSSTRWRRKTARKRTTVAR